MDEKNTPSPAYFDPDAYISSLMGAIGFEDASDSEKDELYELLLEQMNRIVLNAISKSVDGEQLDEALVNEKNNDDLSQFVRRLVKNSPEAQIAVVEALDSFYEQSLDAHKRLK